MKELKEEIKYDKKGITLIALVITIIVLLILAGVTIAMLTGENGILTQSENARNQTDEAEDIEKINLAISEAQIGEYGYQGLTTENLGSALIKDGVKSVVYEDTDGTRHILLLDEKKEYKLDNMGNIENSNIDFDTKYVAPISQDEARNEGVIGIGTDGQPVDMDLWEYTLLEDGTYGLNDEDVFIENYVATSGYSNDNLVNGKIQGAIPQYIKPSEDSDFIAVTNINYLFYNTNLSEAPAIPCTIINMRGTFNTCRDLRDMPSIPYGVVNMYGTFAGCSNLINTSNIPNSVTNMLGTFLECSKLTNVVNIPNSVTNMYSTFKGCTSLIKAPIIPNSVTDMGNTFSNCTSLIEAPTIPNSVTVLVATFKGCSNLQGTLEINANVTGKQLGEEFYNNIDYNNCLVGATNNVGLKLKLTGSCPVLQQIVENANNPNITLN